MGEPRDHKLKIMKLYDKESIVFDVTRYGGEGGKAYFEIQKDIVLSMLGSIREKLIIDLGTGTGKYAGAIGESGGISVGLDISSRMLRQASKKNPKETLWIRADIEHLPLRSNFFDAIICIRTFRFVYSVERALYEINNVLKTNGFFVLNFFNPSSIQGYIGNMLGLYSGEKMKNDLPYRDMINKLNHANFELVQAIGAIWLPSIFWKTKNRFLALTLKSIENIVDRLLPSQAASLVFVCFQKKRSIITSHQCQTIFVKVQVK